VKRELLIAAGAATMVAGMASCSGSNTASGPSSTTPAASGQPQVTIGGQAQNVSGPVVCSTTNGKFSIAVGHMFTGVIVGLEQDGSVVHNAGLGTVNGVVMSFTEGVPGNSATAVKTGGNYKITGTASGVDNSGRQVNKDFTVDVTCP
jgi:lipoprotein LpqH